MVRKSILGRQNSTSKALRWKQCEVGVGFCQMLILCLLRWSCDICFFSLLTYCVTLMDVLMLSQPCIPGINFSWLWCLSSFSMFNTLIRSEFSVYIIITMRILLTAESCSTLSWLFLPNISFLELSVSVFLFSVCFSSFAYTTLHCANFFSIHWKH